MDKCRVEGIRIDHKYDFCAVIKVIGEACDLINILCSHRKQLLLGRHVKKTTQIETNS